MQVERVAPRAPSLPCCQRRARSDTPYQPPRMSKLAVAFHKPMENILLIRLKSIGDVIFTLPAVDALRENFPGRENHLPHLEGKRAVAARLSRGG